MTSAREMREEEMSWNLAQMVNGALPEDVKGALEKITKEAGDFLNHYVSSIDSMHPKSIVQLLENAEKMLVEADIYTTYCNLRFQANTKDKEATQLHDWGRRAFNKMIQFKKLLELPLGFLVSEKPELIQNEQLSNYSHYLDTLRLRVPYQLSAAEEKLSLEKDVNGIELMRRLQRAWIAGKTFDIEIQGEKKTVPFTVLSSLRMNPDRKVREMASRVLYKSFAEDKLLHSTALRSICADHVAMSKRRGMPSTMTQSLLDQDLDEQTVKTLLSVIENTSYKFQEFLKLKAKIMGLPKLAGYDVIAPMVTKPVWEFDWPRAKEVVSDAFISFDEEMGQIVEGMFSNRRIDSANRVGKTTGAFCSSWWDKKTSFVMLSYNNNLNSVYTLAHELGHAVHGHLIYHAQTPLNFRPSACMAETGSISGELLLTDKLLALSETKTQKFEILAHIVDKFFYTVYYVGVRAFCENSFYEAIDKGQLLDADTACEHWNAAKEKVFGDSVEWSEYMEYEWARPVHYFIPRFRFYNYSYSFGQLLVFAIYEAYKNDEDGFAERFKRVLATGRSKSPRDTMKEFGYDIADPGFWELGIKQATRWLDELRTLV